MPDSRLLVDTPATLSVTFYDGETAADPGATTVTITRSDGTAVVTDAATTGSGAAARTYALPAQTRLDHLSAVWSGAGGRKVTTRHEVAGGFYATLAEIRSLDALTNTAKYPTALLEVARAGAEDRFEEATGTAWVPRHRREVLSGAGTSRLLLSGRPPRSLIAASLNGVAIIVGDLRLYPEGVLERAAGATFTRESYGGGGNVIVEYVYGEDAPPWDLKQAFLVYVRYLVLDSTSRVPDRATGMTTEFGTITFASAPSRPTLLPEVDAVLASYDRRIPGVAVA